MTAYQTVVVGTDGSDSSYLAVDPRGEDRGRRRCHARHRLRLPPRPPGGTSTARPDELGSDVAYQVVGSSPAEDSVRTAAERAKKQGATKIDTVVVDGEPVAR